MMKKKIIKTGVFGVVFLALLFLGINIFQKLKTQKEFDAAVQIFQGFILFDLKHEGLLCTGSLSDHKPVMLMFTHSECLFCQEKIRQLIRFKPQLENISIVLVTHAEKDEALEFYIHHNLSQFESLHFLIDEEFEVAQMYGFPTIPSVFLYGADRNLLFKRKGAVKLETVLRHLR